MTMTTNKLHWLDRLLAAEWVTKQWKRMILAEDFLDIMAFNITLSYRPFAKECDWIGAQNRWYVTNHHNAPFQVWSNGEFSEVGLVDGPTPEETLRNFYDLLQQRSIMKPVSDDKPDQLLCYTVPIIVTKLPKGAVKLHPEKKPACKQKVSCA